MKIAIISGYARSGKTTAIEYLRYKGLVCVDTSEYLKERVADFYYSIDRTIPIDREEFITRLTNKDDEFFLNRYNKSARDIQIDFAEDVVVPRFGRAAGIVHPAIETAIARHKKKVKVFVTLGGDEFAIARKWFVSRGYEPILFNIVRPDHDMFADRRQHLPNAFKLFNNGSIADFYEVLDKLLINRLHEDVRLIN